MDKQQLAEEYAHKVFPSRGAFSHGFEVKKDFLAGYEAANIEQEKIKAKIETLTKFRYRSYESIEEELNNLKKQLENDRT